MKRPTSLILAPFLFIAAYIPLAAYFSVPNLLATGTSEEITIRAVNPSFLKWFGLNSSILVTDNGGYQVSFISFSTNVYSEIYVYESKSGDILIGYNSECMMIKPTGQSSYVESKISEGSYLFSDGLRSAAEVCRIGVDESFSYFGRFELSSYRYGPTISRDSKWGFVAAK